MALANNNKGWPSQLSPPLPERISPPHPDPIGNHSLVSMARTWLHALLALLLGVAVPQSALGARALAQVATDGTKKAFSTKLVRGF